MPAKNLRAVRRSRDITGKDMKELLGYKSNATYYKKEGGSCRFTVEEALTIARYLGKSVEELFEESELEASEEKASTGE